MTRIERLQTPSQAVCCVCDHRLSVQDLHEIRSLTDGSVHGEIYCSSCLRDQLPLCRECSSRYTLDGVCEECAVHEYAMAG